MAKVSTQYINHIFDEETSKNAYDFLEKNVPWEKGIYSKTKQQTSRYAYYHNPESNSTVDIFINNLVNIAMNKIENYKFIEPNKKFKCPNCGRVITPKQITDTVSLEKEKERQNKINGME